MILVTYIHYAKRDQKIMLNITNFYDIMVERLANVNLLQFLQGLGICHFKIN